MILLRTYLCYLNLPYPPVRITSYLLSLLNFNNPSRPFRSSRLNLLDIPYTAKAIGHKAFQFVAKTVWNSIPQNIRLLPSIGSFKRSLKSHLFSLPGQPCFPPCYTSASDSSLLEFGANNTNTNNDNNDNNVLPWTEFVSRNVRFLNIILGSVLHMRLLTD